MSAASALSARENIAPSISRGVAASRVASRARSSPGSSVVVAKATPAEQSNNVVFGGTNRVTAARKLGYTHIDCVLLPTFELGMRVQDIQRESYNGTTAEEVGR